MPGRIHRAAAAAIARAGSLGLLPLALLASGCGSGSPPVAEPPDAAQPVALIPEAVREKLLDGAMTVLGRLDQYDEASAFSQVFDRLNQWSHGNPAADAALAADWRIDPLVATLPERLRQPDVTDGLESSVFDRAIDVAALRDQRWLADVSTTARGDAVDDVAVAVRLFEWTIRSLAIDTDPPAVPSETTPGTRWLLPGEILLAGRASPPQRAWIFLQLLRHAGIDGCMLATGPAGASRPWLPVVISAGEAYLFEPTYGLPVPGPDGVGVATLRQAAADPAVLAALSLPDRPYPVQAADLANLTVLVAADPGLLSRRMHVLSERMAGTRSTSLALDPTALVERARPALPDAAAAAGGLWEFPWETAVRRRDPGSARAAAAELAVMSLAVQEPVERDGLQRTRIVRPLFAARVREFRGDLDGPEGAKAAYLASRPTNAVISAAVASLPPPQADAAKRVYRQMKEDATYWLGILTLAEGDEEAAIDYLDRLTLKAAPDSPWTDAARTNLASALAALGRTDEAATLLLEDTSPQRFGSRLRAARMKAAP